MVVQGVVVVLAEIKAHFSKRPRLRVMCFLRVLSFVLSCVLALAAVPQHARATDDECSRRLTPENRVGAIEVIPSGRDADVIDFHRQAIQVLFGQGGVIQQLGLATPPRIMEFAPSGELTQLATLGRHAIGHWYDGSQIATQSGRSAGVLEFAMPGATQGHVSVGCATCRSFYSDTTSKWHQLSIMMHVAGHDDFSVHSQYNRIRPNDVIRAAQRLFEVMERLYNTYDHDEVSHWYQLLLSLGDLQDFAMGTFESPESLRLPLADRILERIQHVVREGMNPYGDRRHPRRPTPSVLQAFVANLPEQTPQWKREIAGLFEEMSRMTPYVVATKIMNEGWDTILMELIPEHTPWATDQYAIEHSDLLQGVARPNLSNPYWLGREAWRIVRRKFNARPEITGLTPLERDRRFIAHAHTMIETMNDYEFLRTALDADFVYRHGLFLERRAGREEWTDLGRPDPNLQNPEQKIVVSSDSRRVIDYIARRVADRRIQIPRVFLQDLGAHGSNTIVLKHDVVDHIPLELTSAGQVLFVIAQVMQRAVELTTEWMMPVERVETRPHPWASGQTITQNIQTVQPVPVKLRVEPSGVASLALINADPAGGELLARVLPNIQTAIAQQQLDLAASVNPDLVRVDVGRQAQAVITGVVNDTLNPHMGSANHAPTTARALLEYAEMVDRRMGAALQRLMSQTTLPNVRNGRIRLQVLPEIPHFRFDRRAHERFRSQQPPSPVDPSLNVTTGALSGRHAGSQTVASATRVDITRELNQQHLRGLNFGIQADDDVGIGSAPRRSPGSGQRRWGEGPPPPGQGDGEGEDEDGEGEGEEGDSPGSGPNPGSGGGSSTEVDITLERYGELLQEQFELPNLRPKPGLDTRADEVLEGGVRRPNGMMRYERMAGDALQLGRMYYQRQQRSGRRPRRMVSPVEMMRRGYGLIESEHHIVADRAPMPEPDIKAVLVIWMDMTGSMMGDPIQRAKELTFNLKALLKARYKNLTFHYIGFTDQAQEFPENKFFRTFMGGGTDYRSGLRKVKEVLDRYNPGQYDRFSFGIGDAEDNDTPEARSLYDEVARATQYSAFVETKRGNWPSDNGFMKVVKDLAAQGPFFNYAVVDNRPESSWEALRRLFGKNRPREE